MAVSSAVGPSELEREPLNSKSAKNCRALKRLAYKPCQLAIKGQQREDSRLDL